MQLTSALFLFLSLTSCTHFGGGDSSAQKQFTKASDIPMEDFFRNPAQSAYRISPDGSQMALFKAWKNRMNIFVHKTGRPESAKQVTFVEDRDISSFWWKGEDDIIYQKDNGGDENFHLYRVNIKTGDTKDLTPLPGVRAQLIDDLDGISADEIIVQHNQRDKTVFDLFRINIRTGESKMVMENKLQITSWLVDHDGNPRGGTAENGLNSIFYFQFEAGQPLKEIFRTGFRNSYAPIAFTADNRNLYVSTNLDSDLQKIVEVDPSEPTKFLRTVYSHNLYDVGGSEYSKARQALGWVTVTTDRRNTYFLNPDDQKDWELLRARFPKMGLALMNTSRDERYWVVRTLSDITRGSFLVYDRKARDVTNLGEISPWLPAGLMSEMQTVHYQSRDGLNIEGYLTIPKGAEAKRLPVVIHPHGGPWHRDEWRFSPDVQFLASRGYAVLQINFRGSTGYGRKFWEASFKQWGRKMQDDVTDGVKWLIAQGYAHPKRICIYGGSYGGYTTLAGITFTPELYRCAIDYVGVSNLLTFMKTIPPYWQPFKQMMYEMVGDPVTDRELLRSASPVFFADKVKAALFIAQGANDPRVNKNESDQMVSAMRKHGVVVEYLVKNNEGHGFHNEENRFDFYRSMEKFLDKHLGGRQK